MKTWFVLFLPRLVKFKLVDFVADWRVVRFLKSIETNSFNEFQAFVVMVCMQTPWSIFSKIDEKFLKRIQKNLLLICLFKLCFKIAAVTVIKNGGCISLLFSGCRRKSFGSITRFDLFHKKEWD